MHLLCNTVGIINMMGSMHQSVALAMRTANATSLGYLLLYLVSLFCSHRLVSGVVHLQDYAMCDFVSIALPSLVCGHWGCALYSFVYKHCPVQTLSLRTSHF